MFRAFRDGDVNYECWTCFGQQAFATFYHHDFLAWSKHMLDYKCSSHRVTTESMPPLILVVGGYIWAAAGGLYDVTSPWSHSQSLILHPFLSG